MGMKSMNGGDGETSYAKNSGAQKELISKTRAVFEETIKDMFIAGENGFPKCMKMADLGCSSGPNTLLVFSHFMDVIENLCKHNNLKLPEIEVFLNDLPDNDFNNLFTLVCQNKRNSFECFMYGVPGSFYGRLFPSDTLNFAYSSYCLHWLSQVPEGLGNSNKENICATPTSPPQVVEAYAKQFQSDFSRFLRFRGQEVRAGGRMFLTFIARELPDFRAQNDVKQNFVLFTETLLEMVTQGMIKEDDLYSWNVPFYPPSMQEVEAIITDEGSFNLDKVNAELIPWDAANDTMVFDEDKCGKIVSDATRAVLEAMLESHFGKSLRLDSVFDNYAKKMGHHLSIGRGFSFDLVISLTRK